MMRASVSRLSPLLLLAAALLAMALLVVGDGAPPAQAQSTPTTLVSNLGQTSGTAAHNDTYSLAQAFTTGSHAGGYTLSSVEVVVQATNITETQRDSYRAEVWSAATGGAPDEKLYDLTVPAHPISTGTVSFAASAGAKLEASTTYYAVFYTVGNASMRLDITASDDEDTGGGAGWTIANGLRDVEVDEPTSTSTWSSEGSNSLKIAVKGNEFADPLKLTALRAEGSADGSSFTALTLDPAFDADTGEYWVTVRNHVTHARLTPTLADTSSTMQVGKFGSRVAVDSGSASAAIALDVGENLISVEITDTNHNADLHHVYVWRAPANQLVGNLGQPTYGGYDTDGTAYASGFTTGSNTGGYTLAGIDAYLLADPSAADSGKFRAELWSAATSGGPDSRVASLTVPSDMGSDAVSFAAPANTTLTASTKYYAVFYTTDDTAVELDDTNRAGNDAGAAPRWSLEDTGYGQEREQPDASETWDSHPASAGLIKIRVRGAAVLGATDLSALAMVTTTDQSTYADTPLNPDFTGETTAYRVAVRNDVTHVKLTPTLADTNSSVKVGKAGSLASVGNGSASADIAVSAGQNDVIVEVTDTNSNTQNYTVTVYRTAADLLVTNVGQGLITKQRLTESLATQAFTTGSDPAGYTLRSIDAAVEVTGTVSAADAAKVTAEVWSNSSDADNPDTKLYDLTEPTSITTGVLTFTAPSNTSLAADTTYHLVLYLSDGLASGVRISWTATDSESEDIAQPGWSVGDENLAGTEVGGEYLWSPSGSPFHVSVNGASKTPVVRFALPHRTRSEADGTAPVFLNISPAPAADISIGMSVTTSGANRQSSGTSCEAGKDFIWLPAAADVTAGTSRVTPAPVICDDNVVEANESFTLTLQPGTGYTLGSPSSYTVTITDDDTPVAPTGLTLTAGNAKLDVSWTAPPGAVTGYDVHYTGAPSTGNGAVADDAALQGNNPLAGWVDASHTGTTASDEITGLDNNQPYRVRVRGRSSAGAGAWAVETETPAPTATTLPGPVGLLTVHLTGNERLTLDWNQPSVGRGTITGYDVHYTSNASVADDAAAQTGGAAAGWVDRGHASTTDMSVLVNLTNDVEHRARVRAKNAQGHGPWAFTSGMPTALPAVSLTVMPNPVPEGDSVAVTVTLNRTVSSQVIVPLTITDGTAEADDHGTLASITIAANTSSASATLTTVHDGDADDETFTVALGNLPATVQAHVGKSSVPVTIDDDEGGGGPTGVSRFACPEEGRVWYARITAGRNTLQNGTVSTGYGVGGANPGSLDIDGFMYGETFYEVRGVTFNTNSNDASLNNRLTVSLERAWTDAMVSGLALHVGTRLFHLSEATVPQGVHTRSRVWNTALNWREGRQYQLCLSEALVSLSLERYPVPEGEDAVVKATLTRPAATDVEIPLLIQNVSAETGDHGSAPTITIPAGQTVGRGVITTNHDDDGDHERFRVKIDRDNLPPTVREGRPNSVPVTIRDDEWESPMTVSLSATPGTVQEGGDVTVTATLHIRGQRAPVPSSHVDGMTIPLRVVRETSEEGDHGTLGSITIPTEQSSASATIWTARDSDGDDETFTVSLGNLPRFEIPRAGCTTGVRVTISERAVEPGSESAQTMGECTYAYDAPDTEPFVPRQGDDSRYLPLSRLEVCWDDEASGGFAECGLATLAAYGYRAQADKSATHVKIRPTATNSGAEVRVRKVTYVDRVVYRMVDGERISVRTRVRTGTDWVSVSAVPRGELSAAFTLDKTNPNTYAEVRILDGGRYTTYLLVIDPPVETAEEPDDTAGAQQDQTPQERYADLIAKIKEWRDDPCCAHLKAHTDRWDRVLLTFGEPVADATLTPMTAAEAQTYADRGWTRWVEVTAALRELEAAAQQAPPPQSPPNNAPVVTSAIADVSGLEEGSTQDVPLSGVFSDADGDSLTVTAASSDETVATVSVAADQSGLTVAGVAEGTATVTVTAQDSDGNRVSDEFDVTVGAPQQQEPPPEEEQPEQDDEVPASAGTTGAPTVAAPLPDISLAGPEWRHISLDGVFHDPDGDDLIVTFLSSNYGVVSGWASFDSSALTVVGISTGTATITATARDPDGNRVSESFEVTVRPAS